MGWTSSTSSLWRQRRRRQRRQRRRRRRSVTNYGVAVNLCDMRSARVGLDLFFVSPETADVKNLLLRNTFGRIWRQEPTLLLSLGHFLRYSVILTFARLFFCLFVCLFLPEDGNYLLQKFRKISGNRCISRKSDSSNDHSRNIPRMHFACVAHCSNANCSNWHSGIFIEFITHLLIRRKEKLVRFLTENRKINLKKAHAN